MFRLEIREYFVSATKMLGTLMVTLPRCEPTGIACSGVNPVEHPCSKSPEEPNHLLGTRISQCMVCSPFFSTYGVFY